MIWIRKINGNVVAVVLLYLLGNDLSFEGISFD